MVKANAYGHGTQEIVSILKDKVACFGVANVQEGCDVRRYTDKPIMVVGKVDDFSICAKHNLEIMIENVQDLKKAKEFGIEHLCHLKINCGMNRFGAKTIKDIAEIEQFLQEHDILLKSICTHFSNTENKKQTESQYKRFCQLRSKIHQAAPSCFGGSGIIKYPFDFQIVRVGIGLYGYEQDNLLPVMKILSHIIKIFNVKKGEYIGYGQKFQAKSNGLYAIVPIGYADGLKRTLSNKFWVKINGKEYKSVGNICMDAFFVEVDKSVKPGDSVIVMDNAEEFARICNTISYEILTGFSNLRGKTKIE